MQEYCCRFRCISQENCTDYEEGCSEVQCGFQYDCEFCRYQDDCENAFEESEVETDD